MFRLEGWDGLLKATVLATRHEATERAGVALFESFGAVAGGTASGESF